MRTEQFREAVRRVESQRPRSRVGCVEGGDPQDWTAKVDGQANSLAGVRSLGPQEAVAGDSAYLFALDGHQVPMLWFPSPWRSQT